MMQCFQMLLSFCFVTYQSRLKIKKMPKHYKNLFLDECIYFNKAKAKM